MNQRTLLTALAVVAVVVLAGAALFIGTDSFNIFAGNAADDPTASARCGPADDPFADPDDPAAGIKFDGRDEHGRYVTGPGGERIYIDESGRRYILGPDGKRTYVNEYGQPVDRHGRPAGDLPGSGSGASNDPSAPAGGPGENPGARPEGENTEEEAKPAELTGSVIDDQGKAYPLATVKLGVEGGPGRSATTNDEGLFKFAELPAGVTLILTAHDEWGNSSKAVTTKLAAGPTKLAPLVLPRDTAIRGVVRDLDTGLPLDGAQVQLLSGGNYGVKQSQATDAGGAFAFAKLMPAGYRLQITRDGYAPRILNSVEPPANLIVEMSAGAVITGTVRNEQGEPLAGARVSCDFHAEPAQFFHTEALTDEAGLYVVKCQPESQHNTLSVLAAGYDEGKKTLVKSGSTEIDFTLRKMAGVVILRGRVLHKSGAPVTAATFSSHDKDSKFRPLLQKSGPDADGRFWCGVDQTVVELRIQSPPLAELRVPFAAAEGGEVDLGDLYFDNGYVVFGIVHEQGDIQKPIKGADVSVGSVHVITGDDGKYRIAGLPASESIVRVLHPAFLGSAIKVTPSASQPEVELNIELSNAAFEARVLVKSSVDSQPLAGVKCTLTAYGQSKTTAADGLLHFTGLSALSIEAVFEKAGFAKQIRPITADVSSKVSEAPPQEVIMTPGDTISGLCTSGGQPIPAASKVEIWDTGKLVVTVLTDTQGKYTTESLPLGQYFVGLPEYHYAARAVELAEEGAEYDVELGPICHLRGRLLRADGQPHANAGVYIYRRDEVYWCGTIHTGPDGKYEVTNLFPGEWVFCALKTQGDTAAQFAVRVEVSKAGWTDKDVALPAITGVITGRVTYPDGQPVKRARVSVTNLSAEFPRALLAAYVVTNDDGYYTAERLENGARMLVRVGGYPDDAKTGTAFSEEITMPSDSSPQEANLEVSPDGVTVNVAMRRADGGPFLNGGPLCYLYDAQGRMSGLYFGGGVFSGSITLHDVIPGTYTLVVTQRGMKRAELQITVGTEHVTTGLEITLLPHERSGG